MQTEEKGYREVVAWIKNEIASGNLKNGDRLMSEKALQDRFSLCRQTIRHATGILVEEGVLYRVQGSGTYVGEYDTGHGSKKGYMNIAVISTYSQSYIFPPTLWGIEQELSERGYAMWLSFTNNKTEREREILEEILSKDNIDGLIVEATKGALPNPNMALYRQIEKRKIPIVFFNDEYREINAPVVRLDDEAVACEAARMLLEAGHTSIAGIFKCDDGQGRRRYLGYIEALRKQGIPIKSKQVIWIDTEDQQSLGELEEHIFRRIEGCTGIVCYNDEVAVEIINMAVRRGIRIPDSLSIVSIDDSLLAETNKVPFTSFPHPTDQLGKKAAESIVKIINKPNYKGTFLFNPKPKIRNSIKNFKGE